MSRLTGRKAKKAAEAAERQRLNNQTLSKLDVGPGTYQGENQGVELYHGPGSYQGGGVDELSKITPRPAQLINTQESDLTDRGDSMGKAGKLNPKLKTEDYTKQTPAEKYDQPFIAFGDKEFNPTDYPNYPHTSEDGTMVMTDAFFNKTKNATQANEDQTAQATSQVKNTDYQNGKVDAENTDQNSDVDFETPPKNNTSTDLSENATETKQEDSLDNKDGDNKGDGKDGGKKKNKGIIPTRTNTTASNTGTTIKPPSAGGGGATPNQTRGLANKNWGLA